MHTGVYNYDWILAEGSCWFIRVLADFQGGLYLCNA